ncbi:MAG TPA: hypothetical protein VIL85_05215 [Thermomicrobiales bacterium]|jgi:hypothetical protein
MSRESVQALLARAEREPTFRAIVETNGYVALAGYDLTAEESDAAQRWDLPALRRLAGQTEKPSTDAGA